MARARIGISGWTYKPWRGTFYPKDLPHKRELEYASRKFNSIEINGSFYSLQRPSSYRKWYQETPDDFVFSVKGGRFITHMLKLKGVESALANFFASGILALNEKLGPILWQLPPMLKFDAGRIESFLEQLPRDTTEAAKLGKRHNEKLKGRAHVETDKKRPMRHAMEVRHPTFEDSKFIDLLRSHNVAMVVADTAGKWPVIEDLTADFVYVRLHGDEELYVSGYTDEALDMWAAKVRPWLKGRQCKDARTFGKNIPALDCGRDVYVYFDNDAKVKAPFDAMGLARRLGVGPATHDETPDLSGVTEPARESWPPLVRTARKTAAPRRPASRTRTRTPS
jgi:uncharacterized protein YecE (DUF72 family)